MKNYNLIFSPGILLSLLAACTNAPDAEKAKTTEAKEVSAATGETWNVDTTESKIEWVATKVSGYHTGTVNIKSGELNIQDGKPTGGNFVLDMTSMIVSGPPGNDEESNNKLLA